VLSEDGHPLLGLFLGGCNEDRLSDAMRWHKPGPAFLRTPIFLSHGREDRLATAVETASIVETMQRSGFQSVRAEPYDGGHELDLKELARALEWFRSAAAR
jgi:predicted esterase